MVLQEDRQGLMDTTEGLSESGRHHSPYIQPVISIPMVITHGGIYYKLQWDIL